MKGGYQIIDLSKVGETPTTIPGAYDAFKGANGKPVLIITPDGNEVFAKVKEGTLGTYEASYIDGEKVYSVVVDSVNNVLIEEIEIGGGGGGASTSYTIGTPIDVDITDGSATVPPAPDVATFTATSDGIVVVDLDGNYEGTGAVDCHLSDPDSEAESVHLYSMTFDGNRAINTTISFFICKGLVFEMQAVANGGVDTIKFYPLVTA